MAGFNVDAMPVQNPFRCSDNNCVLLVPGAPRGMGTNGGCHCLRHMEHDPEKRVRVRNGIRWLAGRAGGEK